MNQVHESTFMTLNIKTFPFPGGLPEMKLEIGKLQVVDD